MIFLLSALFGQRIAFDVFLAVFEVAFCIFRVSRRIDDELAQLCLKLFLGQRGKLFVEFLRGPLDIAENQGVSVFLMDSTVSKTASFEGAYFARNSSL